MALLYMQSIHQQQARSAQVKLPSLAPSPTPPVISRRVTVGVQLLKSDNTTIIEPNTPMPDSDAQQLQAGKNELNFFARLIALDNGVTPGDFNASVTYTLKYL